MSVQNKQFYSLFKWDFIFGANLSNISPFIWTFIYLLSIKSFYPTWIFINILIKKVAQHSNCWLISLFNGVSTFVGNLMLNPSLWKNSTDTIKPIAQGIKGFILFPRVLVENWMQWRNSGLNLNMKRLDGWVNMSEHTEIVRNWPKLIDR